LNQPFSSGARASASLTLGAVESYWSVALALAVLPA
jgi:hypothetical protein